MQIDDKNIRHIANLARIAISDSEVKQVSVEMSKVLTLFAQMDKVDTSNVEVLAHPLELAQPLREDKVTEINERDELSKLSTDTQKHHYIVPKVID